MEEQKTQLGKVMDSLASHSRRIGHGRLLRLFAVSLIIWSVVLPLAGWISDLKSYQLSAATEKVIGAANPNLSAKFSYVQGDDVWRFNKDGKAIEAAAIARQQGTDAASVGAVLAQLKAQVGGGGAHDQSLYSVDLPTKADKGMTFYDNQSAQSFSMTPQFDVHDGKKWQGRVVYPFDDGGQIVYTAKTNGIKEDIVLNKNIGDALHFTYKLKLPKTLEARLTDNGSIGIYSADPALYSNITYGADADRVKIESARETAVKDHLVFGIPAPVIKDAAGRSASASYILQGDALTVSVSGLNKLSYPLSVDPSVVLTSSSDFETGNHEGMIDFSTSGQIGRDGMTGGGVSGGWSTSTNVNGSTNYAIGGVTYNGYIYRVVGLGGGKSISYNTVANGAVGGAWTTIANIFPVNLIYASVFAYNGYMYVIGGFDTAATSVSSVYYLKINSDGTLGSLNTSTHTLPNAVCRQGSAVYNGYVYIVAGEDNTSVSSCANTSTGLYASTQYAKLQANGDVGTWTVSSNLLSDAVMSPGVAAYNGYLYSFAGGTSGSTGPRTIQYAQINSDGSIGAWAVTGVNYTGSIEYRHGFVAYNGYLYWFKSNSGLTMYAQINDNGTVGTWRPTTDYGATLSWGSAVLPYKGYIYKLGGNNTTNQTLVGKIDNEGTISDYSTAATAPGSGLTNIGTGRTQGAAAVYNNCMYLVGGYNGTSRTTTVYQTTVSSGGVLGTWAVATNGLATGVSDFGFAIYNGYMYVIGGTNGTSNQSIVQYASFNSSGCGTSTWTTNATAYTGVVADHAVVAYNGYLYATGGDTSGSASTKMYTAAISSSNGSVGSWTQQTATLNQSRVNEALAINGPYIYVVGGIKNSPDTPLTNVEYIKITGNGTIDTAWTQTSSLNTARSAPAVTISGSYLYAIGGDNIAGTNYATTESVKINADGSLGGGNGTNWDTNTTLTSTYSAAPKQIVRFDDDAYMISGSYAGTQARTVSTITLNNGGSGRDATPANSTAFTTARSAAGSVAYNGYLYLAGGVNSSSTYYNDVQYASIAADGTVGSWTSTSALSGTRSEVNLLAYNGYMYAVGGYTGSLTNDVQYAAINSNGTLGSWASTTSFTTARRKQSAVAYNGYLYVLGGFTTVSVGDVQYAPISSNGTVGSWTSTTALGSNRSAAGAFAYHGYLYAVGGTDDTNYLNTVQYATINSNGTIGTWSSTTNFNRGRSALGVSAYNGYVYISGGTDASKVGDVQYAPINSNGTIGTWSTGESLTSARNYVTTAIYKGTYYAVGGLDSGGTSLTDVQYAQLNTIARRGHYTKLVDLGNAATVTAVTYNGTMSTESTLRYATADSTGALSAYTSGTAGAAPGSPSLCVDGTTRYVSIAVDFDDSDQMVFGAGDFSSNTSDITVTYGLSARPLVQNRLYGGKSFKSEVLQPLDVCGP